MLPRGYGPGQHTPLSECNAYGERSWLPRLSRTQTSEQEFSDVTPVPSGHGTLATRHSRNTPQSFPRGIRSYAFEVDKTGVNVFLYATKISQILAGEWKLGLQCYGRNENRTGYHPALFEFYLDRTNIAVARRPMKVGFQGLVTPRQTAPIGSHLDITGAAQH